MKKILFAVFGLFLVTGSVWAGTCTPTYMCNGQNDVLSQNGEIGFRSKTVHSSSNRECYGCSVDDQSSCDGGKELELNGKVFRCIDVGIGDHWEDITPKSNTTGAKPQGDVVKSDTSGANSDGKQNPDFTGTYENGIFKGNFASVCDGFEKKQRYINCTILSAGSNTKLSYSALTSNNQCLKSYYEEGYISADEYNRASGATGSKSLESWRSSSVGDSNAKGNPCYKRPAPSTAQNIKPTSASATANNKFKVGDCVNQLFAEIYIRVDQNNLSAINGMQNIVKVDDKLCGGPAPVDRVVPEKKDTKPEPVIDAYNKVKEIEKSFNVSGWVNKEGTGFNWTRFGADAAGGTVVGAGTGILVNSMIKDSQLEDGYKSIQCTFGIGGTADYEETFIVR
jgi:hypothetical protein